MRLNVIQTLRLYLLPICYCARVFMVGRLLLPVDHTAALKLEVVSPILFENKQLVPWMFEVTQLHCIL